MNDPNHQNNRFSKNRLHFRLKLRESIPELSIYYIFQFDLINEMETLCKKGIYYEPPNYQSNLFAELGLNLRITSRGFLTQAFFEYGTMFLDIAYGIDDLCKEYL